MLIKSRNMNTISQMFILVPLGSQPQPVEYKNVLVVDISVSFPITNKKVKSPAIEL